MKAFALAVVAVLLAACGGAQTPKSGVSPVQSSYPQGSCTVFDLPHVACLKQARRDSASSPIQIERTRGPQLRPQDSPPPGTARLSWTEPTTGEFDGYMVEYGTSPDDLELQQRVFIEDASITGCEIVELTPGATYYFVLRVLDHDVVVGDASNTVSLTV